MIRKKDMLPHCWPVIGRIIGLLLLLGSILVNRIYAPSSFIGPINLELYQASVEDLAAERDTAYIAFCLYSIKNDRVPSCYIKSVSVIDKATGQELPEIRTAALRYAKSAPVIAAGAVDHIKTCYASYIEKEDLEGYRADDRNDSFLFVIPLSGFLQTKEGVTLQISYKVLNIFPRKAHRDIDADILQQAALADYKRMTDERYQIVRSALTPEKMKYLVQYIDAIKHDVIYDLQNKYGDYIPEELRLQE